MASFNDITEGNTGLQPPQLPRTGEVSDDIALRYFDAYHAYTTVYMRAYDTINDGKRDSAMSGDSVVPSMSASQTNLAIPAIVRIDSRESNLSCTPPNLPSEYPGLIAGEKDAGPGFCYLALICESRRTEVQDKLDRYPTFRSILSLSKELFVSCARLRRMQISRVAPGHYHLLTGTIMPNALTIVTAIAQRSRDTTDAADLAEDVDSMYNWLLSMPVSQSALEHAPLIDDILGSSRRSFHTRRYDTPWRPSPATYYDALPSPSSAAYYDTVPTYQRSGQRTHRGVSVVEPRADRDYHYVRSGVVYPHAYEYRTPRVDVPYERGSGRERSSRNRSLDYDYESYDSTYREISPMPNDSSLDLDYQRALRDSEAEYRHHRTRHSDTMYDYSDMQREVDNVTRNVSPPPRTRQRSRTTGSSHISSTTSSSSVKVAGSLEGIVCVICQDPIAEGGGFLQCGHVFHSACVDPWLAQCDPCPTCPTCRSQL